MHIINSKEILLFGGNTPILCLTLSSDDTNQQLLLLFNSSAQCILTAKTNELLWLTMPDSTYLLGTLTMNDGTRAKHQFLNKKDNI